MRLRRFALMSAAFAVLLGVAVPPAAASSHAPTVPTPGGLAPHEQVTSGDCEVSGVLCKPSRSGSCTGYSSQTTPPASILVLVRTGSNSAVIEKVPFEQYVENVLPNEWIGSWDGDALKAGAVAVKSYAWYWVTHYGGTYGGKCFDVTDDQDFQVYKAGSAQTRTTSAVEQSWPVAARRNGQIIQTFYRSYLNSSNESCGAYATGTTMSQYGTQTCNEANTGNKYNVILGRYYYPDLQLATTRQVRSQHDFQFLQKSTEVTFHAGTWSIDDGYPTTLHYGLSGDIPAVNTVGDGFARFGVFRPSNSTWYLAGPTGAQTAQIRFGLPGDVPVQAQYNGLDRPTVLAVWRPSSGNWYQAAPNSGSVASVTQWGLNGDVPVPGRYTSTSADQLAVWRPSNGTWYVRGSAPVRWGLRGDVPVPADYNGDGKTDFAVYRPSNHSFYVRGQSSVRWGLSGDVPVTGDFNGNGRSDLAVYRPSNHSWYVYGGATTTWGSSGATPIGRAPYHD